MFAVRARTKKTMRFLHLLCALLKYKNMAASKTNNFSTLFIYAYQQNKSINYIPMLRIYLLHDSPNIKILKLFSCLLFCLTEKRVTFRAKLVYFWAYLIQKLINTENAISLLCITFILRKIFY